MFRTRRAGTLCASLLLALAASTTHATPFATTVIDFTQGTNGSEGFDDPSAALGIPTLDTGFGDVTPFNSPFTSDHILSIGAGGELVVGFSGPVEDDPLNPFGIDLLIFGNSFFFDPSFAPIANDIFVEPGQISVSQDGDLWFEITSIFADGLFPTLAFVDTSGPFESDGRALSDFTRPVDPSIDWMGTTFDGIVALYAGSAGGAGVDIAETGLPWIQFVRVSQAVGDPFATEIDGFADVRPVPEPTTLLLLCAGLTGLGLLRRRSPRETPGSS